MTSKFEQYLKEAAKSEDACVICGTKPAVNGKFKYNKHGREFYCCSKCKVPVQPK